MSEVHLTDLKPGDTFGELGIRTNSVREASVVALAVRAARAGGAALVGRLTRRGFPHVLRVLRGVLRPATAAAQPMELLLLPADEYRATIKIMEDRMLEEKIEFFRGTLVFDSLPHDALMHIASVAHTRYFDRDSVVIK